jgi:predicted site-specific integrase-resolvase
MNEYLTEAELAVLWGVKKNTLQKWRSKGVGPMYIKRVGSIVYRQVDIERFERENMFKGTHNQIDANEAKCY